MKKETLCQHLSEIIQFETVTYFDRSLEDQSIFEALIAYLKKTYPLVHEKTTLTRIGQRGLLYTLPGGSRSCVLMAHYDVVPAVREDWSDEPFSGRIGDGMVFGRGTLDTKSSFCCIFEALEEHLAQGKTFEHTLYLAFSGEEEIEGPAAEEIMQYLKDKGVRPEFVLDEGGAIFENGIPGVNKAAAMVGVAEKGVVNMKMTVKGRQGHASVPPKHTAAGKLAAACAALEKHPFGPRLTDANVMMFQAVGRQRGGLIGFLFRHVNLYRLPVALLASYLGGTFNAMVRTTAAVTMLQGSESYNILPKEAEAGINLRLLRGDTIESATARMARITARWGAEFTYVSGSNPSPVSRADGEPWTHLEKTVATVWPGTITVPYTMNGGTDSRVWHEICDRVYKFTPMVMTREETATAHGIDEKIRIEALEEMGRFFLTFLAGL
ncbi:MAG: M20/M25/M40 family metallo-hydrolase [Lachnospiraceae bacterium]|nr:M20/M25/M40 family metallo-hydrolase [Lachnospiraceae bacterium]